MSFVKDCQLSPGADKLVGELSARDAMQVRAGALPPIVEFMLWATTNTVPSSEYSRNP